MKKQNSEKYKKYLYRDRKTRERKVEAVKNIIS